MDALDDACEIIEEKTGCSSRWSMEIMAWKMKCKSGAQSGDLADSDDMDAVNARNATNAANPPPPPDQSVPRPRKVIFDPPDPRCNQAPAGRELDPDAVRGVDGHFHKLLTSGGFFKPKKVRSADPSRNNTYDP